MGKSFLEVGLPSSHIVQGLAFHKPSATLIAHMAPSEAVPHGKGLYFRWPGCPVYQPVLRLSGGTSIDSFVIDPLGPSLYFLTLTWKDRNDIEVGAFSGKWEGIYRFDLAGHTIERLGGLGTLLLPKGYEEGWLCQLLSIGGNARSIICKAGLKRSSLENGAWRVNYCITELNLADMRLDLLDDLVAVFA
jgi:hypothetical protein